MATKAIQVELLLGGVMDDGDVALAGGKVFTYAAGTLTNKTTWTDRDKTTPAANPIILDAAGKATIFADGVYKFVIKDADDVTIRTIDNLEFGTALTGTISFSKGADIASSSALTIGTDGNYFDITGTTTITSINAVGIGTVIKLHFDDVLTLTHHATNLILPGSASIVTAAGDEAEFIEYAIGDWICTNYQKTNGLPINVFVKGADVVSEAALFTTAAFPADGNYLDVTDTNAITSIITSGRIGTVIKLHFDAALTLTHDATDLILPGGANITTAAGDEAEFIEYATGDWRCLNYQTAAIVPGLLDEDNMASNSATTGATQQSIKAYAISISVTNGDAHDHSGGDGGALSSGSFAAGAVDQDAIGTAAVGQDELKTATGSFNATISGSSDANVETHAWGHTPSVGSSNSSDVHWSYATARRVNGSGEVLEVQGNNDAGANRTGHLEWIYHNT